MNAVHALVVCCENATRVPPFRWVNACIAWSLPGTCPVELSLGVVRFMCSRTPPRPVVGLKSSFYSTPSIPLHDSFYISPHTSLMPFSTCTVCHTLTRQRCARCKAAFYCGVLCQVFMLQRVFNFSFAGRDYTGGTSTGTSVHG